MGKRTLPGDVHHRSVPDRKVPHRFSTFTNFYGNPSTSGYSGNVNLTYIASASLLTNVFYYHRMVLQNSSPKLRQNDSSGEITPKTSEELFPRAYRSREKRVRSLAPPTALVATPLSARAQSSYLRTEFSWNERALRKNFKGQFRFVFDRGIE